MIHGFSCDNFRNISVKDIELSRLNILIGPNGSGKKFHSSYYLLFQYAKAFDGRWE